MAIRGFSINMPVDTFLRTLTKRSVFFRKGIAKCWSYKLVLYMLRTEPCDLRWIAICTCVPEPPASYRLEENNHWHFCFGEVVNPTINCRFCLASHVAGRNSASAVSKATGNQMFSQCFGCVWCKVWRTDFWRNLLFTGVYIYGVGHDRLLWFQVSGVIGFVCTSAFLSFAAFNKTTTCLTNHLKLA